MTSSQPTSFLNFAEDILDFRIDGKCFDDICSTLAARDRTLDARAAALDRRETALDARVADLDRREAALSEHEVTLMQRGRSVSAYEAGLPSPGTFTRTMMRLSNEEATPTAARPAASGTTASVVDTGVPIVQHEVTTPTATDPAAPDATVSSSADVLDTAVPIIRSPRPEIARGIRSSRDRPRVPNAAIPASQTVATTSSSFPPKRQHTDSYIGPPRTDQITDDTEDGLIQTPRYLKRAVMKDIERKRQNGIEEALASCNCPGAGFGAEEVHGSAGAGDRSKESGGVGRAEAARLVELPIEIQSASALLDVNGRGDGGQANGSEGIGGQRGGRSGKNKPTESEAQKAMGQLLVARLGKDTKDERSLQME